MVTMGTGTRRLYSRARRLGSAFSGTVWVPSKRMASFVLLLAVTSASGSFSLRRPPFRTLAAGGAAGERASAVRALGTAQGSPTDARTGAGFDQPDAANAMALAKRLPQGEAGSVTDAPLAYRRARAQVRRMARYATASGRDLPSQRDARSAPGAALWPGSDSAVDVEGLGSASAAGTTGAGAQHASAADAVGRMQRLDTWKPLGPGNIGGRTHVLAIDPTRPATMYAGGVSGGVWKSTTGGARWFPVGEEMANIAINSMIMDPEDPATIYVGTGEGYFREVVRGTGLPLRGGGIFKTTDAGATWQHLASTRDADFHWVNDLLISPHNSRRVYAATRTGVFRSKNGPSLPTWGETMEVG